MIRHIVQQKDLPGEISESGAGLELLGFSTQDHQHTYDQGHRLIAGTDYPNGVDGWQIQTSPIEGWELTVPCCAKLGNMVIFEGWLMNVTNSPQDKTSTLLTVPISYRPSPEVLPLYFPIVHTRGGSADNRPVRMDTDFVIRWVTGPGTVTIGNIQLSRIRYMLK